jgi:hypothetical protein
MPWQRMLNTEKTQKGTQLRITHANYLQKCRYSVDVWENFYQSVKNEQPLDIEAVRH